MLVAVAAASFLQFVPSFQLCSYSFFLTPGTESSEHANQIGSRYRRSRTAAARNIAATASPTHRPGVLKNCTGVSADIISIRFPLRAVVVEGSGPVKRYCSMPRKCEVLNAIFSTPQITNGGKNAHINGARGAQAETSSNQP